MEIAKNSKPDAPSQKLTGSSWLLTLGLLLVGIGGGFAPWVWREIVALQLTAPGLAEFVKFLPEIRGGQIQIERLYFLLPLFFAMLMLPLLASNKKLVLPNWYRWSLRLVVVPLALASLSPVWTPAILRAPEFRLQTILAVMTIGLALLAPLLKNLPLRLLVILSSGGGIISLILPTWQFSLVQASISEVYHEPVSLGWGWWLMLAGVILTVVGGVWRGFLTDPPRDYTNQAKTNAYNNPTPSNGSLNLSFQPNPLVRNRHVQTIASSLFNRKGPNLIASSQEMILDAGQGVRLQGFYSPQPNGQSKGLVLILHGWLGHANATYIITTGEYLYDQGYSIFRLNFRDHGDTHHLNPGIFRGDLLDEAFGAAQHIAELESNQPFHIIGASMGGSFALRIAWRHIRAPIHNLGQTIAINPSVNPYSTVLALDTGLPIYLAYFRRKWRQAFEKKKATFPDRYDIAKVIAASTCMTMTEAFIPYSPHPNALVYLDSYAVTPEMMADLKSPVTIITAADDPIVPIADIEPFYNVSPYLNISIQPYGGHVGFIDIFPYRHWLNEAIVAILETTPIPRQSDRAKFKEAYQNGTGLDLEKLVNTE